MEMSIIFDPDPDDFLNINAVILLGCPYSIDKR